MNRLAPSCAADKPSRRPDANPDADLQYQIGYLHRLGLRPIEVSVGTCPRCHDLVLERVGQYAELVPEVVHWRDAGSWIEPAAVVLPMAGGRP
jgi:hypothetical protein